MQHYIFDFVSTTNNEDFNILFHSKNSKQLIFEFFIPMTIPKIIITMHTTINKKPNRSTMDSSTFSTNISTNVKNLCKAQYIFVV